MNSKISPALRWYRKTAMINMQMGLTCKGARRKRRPNADNRRREILRCRDRNLMAWNLRVNRLRQQGLTTRGTPRIYAVRRADALILKSQIDGLVRLIAKIFHDLPPPAQARALELENQFGAILKQLL